MCQDDQRKQVFVIHKNIACTNTSCDQIHKCREMSKDCLKVHQ